jgi:DNA invertase Pin-like site-specific DNA recombinase
MALAKGYRLEELEVVEEVESGARRRPRLEELVTRCKRGEVVAVFVWALDRLSREGVAALVPLLEDLERHNVALYSYTEPWLDTVGPVRELLLSVFAWVAKMERRRLVERTRAGLDRARRQGRRLGRPRALERLSVDAAQVANLVKLSGVSGAARALGIARGTVRKVVAEHRAALATSPATLELQPSPRRK